MVCWEIFSNDEYLHFTLASNEVVAKRVVDEILRLMIPEGCPSDVFDLMYMNVIYLSIMIAQSEAPSVASFYKS